MLVASAIVAAFVAVPVKQPVAAVPAKPALPEFELRFVDESIVRATLLDPSIRVATRYGKLTIPVADVRKIELGFRYPAGVEATLTQAVADLASPDFKTREQATAKLLAAKEYAGPLLQKAVKSKDAETVKRAEELIKSIKEKLPEERQDLKGYDTIETTEFTFQGILETTSLKAKTKYFAETDLKVVELRGLRSQGVEATDSIALDVGQYGRPNDQNWMATKFEIVAGRPLEISVSGTIDLWPQQGGQYVVGPNGQPQHGTGTPIMSQSGRGYGYASGTVVGKIGPTGEPFLIGAGQKIPRAAASGKLYLKMASPPWGNAPSGSYKVTIKSGS